MKRLLTVAVIAITLIALYSVYANDLQVDFDDTIAAADTVAASKRIDTVLGSWYDLRDFSRVQFFSGVYDDGNDTNWTGDTFFVKFQTSPNQIDVLTYEIDTFTAVGTALSAAVLNLSKTDSVFGRYGRAMLVHWDSLEADSPDILGNTYNYKLKLWIQLSE